MKLSPSYGIIPYFNGNYAVVPSNPANSDQTRLSTESSFYDTHYRRNQLVYHAPQVSTGQVHAYTAQKKMVVNQEHMLGRYIDLFI